MDDVELAIDHDLAQFEDGLEIGPGADAVDQAGHDARGEAHVKGAVSHVIAARRDGPGDELHFVVRVVAQVAGNVQHHIGRAAGRQAGDDQQDAQAARGGLGDFLIGGGLNGVVDKFHSFLVRIMG